LPTLRTTEPSPKGRLDATTAACLVFLAHQESPERTENQANLVFPVHPAFPVVLHWRSARKFHRHHANRAHQDHPVQPVHLANLVHPVQLATPAALAKMAATDHLAQLAPTDHPEAQAKTERKDPLVPQPKACHRPLVMLVQPVKTAHPVHPVKTAHLAQTAVPAQQEAKVPQARLVRLATTELQETKDHPVQMDPKASLVFARNIAPPMAVFSSKMEQGDKRSHQAFRVCYTDEKPVFFMSMFAFIIYFFILFDGQISSSSIILHQYCRCVSRH